MSKIDYGEAERAVYEVELVDLAPKTAQALEGEPGDRGSQYMTEWGFRRIPRGCWK
jgi:hypothetical protein